MKQATAQSHEYREAAIVWITSLQGLPALKSRIILCRLQKWPYTMAFCTQLRIAQILLTFDALRCVALGNADGNVAGASCGAEQAFGCLSQTFPTICHPSLFSFSKTSATLAPGAGDAKCSVLKKAPSTQRQKPMGRATCQ